MSRINLPLNEGDYTELVSLLTIVATGNITPRQATKRANLLLHTIYTTMAVYNDRTDLRSNA